MKKTLLILTLGLAALQFSVAQTTEGEKALKTGAKEASSDKWDKGGTFNLNFSQVSLTNWAGGGQNSVALNGLLSLYANRKINKWNWENNFDFAYGLLKQGESESPFIKNDDRIEINSKIGRQINEHWYYAGLLNFRTQFAPGFADPLNTEAGYISRFMAPGYMLVALGLDYKPNDNFSMFVAPITSKSTFVMDSLLASQGAFGVTPGKMFREELGGYVRFSYKRDLIDNVTFDTKLDLFTNYLDNPGYIDVNWTTLLTMKVNKYVSCTFSTHLIYDDDIHVPVIREDGTPGTGPRTQFKQMFGAGLAYKF